MVIQEFLHKNQHLFLHASRAIFWQEKRALILSDSHFGKTGHFRKAGIAIPQTIFKDDLHRFIDLLQFFKPDTVIIVGDLFHSAENKEFGLFKKWRNDFPAVTFNLIKGNHDLLDNEWYESAGLIVHNDRLIWDSFCFLHDPDQADQNTSLYNFCGHLHPGITMKGRGKQAIQLPCFYFTDNYCILPAFSHFTGTAAVDIKKGKAIFALPSNKEIIRIV